MRCISRRAILALALPLLSCALRGVVAPLEVGPTAPPVLLASTDGPQDSRQALQRGPLVLIFYRGHW